MKTGKLPAVFGISKTDVREMERYQKTVAVRNLLS